MLTGVINLRGLVASKAWLNAALRRQRYSPHGQGVTTSCLAISPELLQPMDTSAFGRSRPAADASREVVERWLLDGL
jgi:hypothetical protein